MVKSTWLSVLIVLAINAPSAHAQDAHAPQKIRVANEGAVGDAWMLQPANQPDVLQYPAEYADNPADACLAIGFLINPDGQTSDFGLLKSWSSKAPKRNRDHYWGALAEVASSTLSEWRFVPKPGVAETRPVYTVATFVFDSPNAAESRKRCEIQNLSNWIFNLKTDTRSRNRISLNEIFERLEVRK